MQAKHIATLRAAEACWVAGDDSRAAQLADDAAFEARAVRDIDAAIQAVDLREMATRVLALSTAATGWGTR